MTIDLHFAVTNNRIAFHFHILRTFLFYYCSAAPWCIKEQLNVLYLDWNTKIVAIFYSWNQQLHPHLDLKHTQIPYKQNYARRSLGAHYYDNVCWWGEHGPTVLHFSMRVRISGLTLSIRSTSLPLLFIIPPGIIYTLVPPTTYEKRMLCELQESFTRKATEFMHCRPYLSHLLHHLQVFSSWHFAANGIINGELLCV